MLATKEPNGRTLATNGFEVVLPEAVDVIVRPFPDNSRVQEEREQLAEHWFVHWFEGELYHLRLNPGGPNIEGESRSLVTHRHPWLLRARLDDALGDVFSAYKPFRIRPFSFLAQRTELVKTAAEAAGIDRHLLDGLTVTPRFELNAKIYEPADGDVRVGVFVTIGMRYDIAAHLPDLSSKGVRLTGLHVVRRNPQPDEKRHLGRICSIDGPIVNLDEARGEERVKVGEVKLEGSKESFAHCLAGFVGRRKSAFDKALETAESIYRLGPDFDQRLKEMGGYLAKKSIELGDGVSATIGARVDFANDGDTKLIYDAPPVDYVFDRSGASSARYAWDGLVQYGPYDRTSFSTRSPRILAVFPKATQGKVETFLAAFKNGMGAQNRAYETGFTKTMGLVKTDFVMCPVEISGTAKADVAHAYRTAIERLLQNDNQFHAAFVFIHDEHADLKGCASPYIQTKSMLLTLGIASQDVRMATVSQRSGSLAYTLRNIAASVYAKMNGTPWTVHQDQKIADELVIGMGFAELSGSRVDERQRHVGITTVFSGDGAYILGNISKECLYADYPKVVGESILEVLRDVKKRNNWQPGDIVRIIFHAHRPLKRIDVAKIVFRCAREVGSDQDVQLAFVTVTHDHPFMLIDPSAPGVPVKHGAETRKGVFAPDRGAVVRLGRHTRLLAVKSGTLIKRQHTPLPKPLLVSVHRDSTFTDVDYLSEQVLKFTCLSWRSVLPSDTPVTISYSEHIANLLGRLREVPDWSPVALSVKLKYSRWFL